MAVPVDMVGSTQTRLGGYCSEALRRPGLETSHPKEALRSGGRGSFQLRKMRTFRRRAPGMHHMDEPQVSQHFRWLTPHHACPATGETAKPLLAVASRSFFSSAWIVPPCPIPRWV